MRRTAPRPVLILASALALAPSGCDDGSGLDHIPVTVRGTVTGQGGAPVENVWVHLLAGPQSAPFALTAAETDISGAYSIETTVDPADCNDLHLRVLPTSAFNPSTEPLDQSLLGSCGDLAVDFIIDTEPPLQGAGPDRSRP